MRQKKNTSEVIYDNCEVYSNEDKLLSYTSKKKALKLLRWGKAELIKESPLTIRFNRNLKTSVPKNILIPRDNICVCCGTSKNLTKHHIIPHEYSKFMGIWFKKYNYGNILPLCFMCHRDYEVEAKKIKIELAKKYNAPFVDRESIQIYSLCYTILNSGDIPYEKIIVLYNRLSEVTNLPKSFLTEEYLLKQLEERHRKNNKSHSEIVWNNVKDKLDDFIIMWKKHFIEYAKPNFLPKFWHYYIQ